MALALRDSKSMFFLAFVSFSVMSDINFSAITSQSLDSCHKDLIHDISFSPNGKRMATCSTDQSVIIWSLNDKGEWEKGREIKNCHNASTWRVVWAPAEFGNVLATCSFDRVVFIWEEYFGGGGSSAKGQWVKRATFVDSRASVTDVKFAPRFHGLKLAVTSGDGHLRIYEVTDVMSLTQWTISQEINAKLYCSAVSWSDSRLHPFFIALGGTQALADTVSTVQLYEYSMSNKKWDRVDTPALEHREPVLDVAFAPSVGRSYLILAVALRRVVKIFSLETGSSSVGGGLTVTYKLPALEHAQAVWRISWNIVGTVLAASCEDGVVYLWKSDSSGGFSRLATVKPSGQIDSTSADSSLSSGVAAVGASPDASLAATERHIKFEQSTSRSGSSSGGLTKSVGAVTTGVPLSAGAVAGATVYCAPNPPVPAANPARFYQIGRLPQQSSGYVPTH